MKFNTVLASLIIAFMGDSSTAASVPRGTIQGNGVIEAHGVVEANGVVEAHGIIEVLSVEGGFASSCTNIHIDSRIINGGQHIYSVYAHCTGHQETSYNTNIQLNRCLKNFNGDLEWADIGYFDDSCKNCSLVTNDKNEEEMILTCTCGTGGRGDKTASINLNDGIRNEAGTLWCGKQIGNRN